jgi:hypothetical protein
MKPFASCIRILSVILITCAITPALSFAYEEAMYKTIQTYDDFELRQYRPIIVAEVTVKGEFGDVGSSSFRILFDYISGNNAPREALEMNAPVSQQPATGQKIDMTTPVLQSPMGDSIGEYMIQSPMGDSIGEYKFSFVMPSGYTLETIPIPVDNRILIREIPAKTIAVRTYSGSWSESNYRKNEARLMQSLIAQGFKPIAKSVYARYNSPFSLWFMRRNETMVEVGYKQS